MPLPATHHARTLRRHHFLVLRSKDQTALGVSQLFQVAMMTLVAAVLSGGAQSAPIVTDFNLLEAGFNCMVALLRATVLCVAARDHHFAA